MLGCSEKHTQESAEGPPQLQSLFSSLVLLTITEVGCSMRARIGDVSRIGFLSAAFVAAFGIAYEIAAIASLVGLLVPP